MVSENKAPRENSGPVGRLHLVGMGVGGPENMTLRAFKTVADAQVIFAMERVQEEYAEILGDKEVHEAGHGLFESRGPRLEANAAREKLEQETRRLVREAVAAGRNVAVLTLGDPLIFGSQSGFLQEFADLSPEIVPGLSSFNVANAALGRKITGGPAHAVVLTAAMDLESLERLAADRPTLVLFTMKLHLEKTVQCLLRHYPGDTPVAAVERAGFAGQEVIHATLETLVRTLGDRSLFARLLYIGDFLR